MLKCARNEAAEMLKLPSSKKDPGEAAMLETPTGKVLVEYVGRFIKQSATSNRQVSLCVRRGRGVAKRKGEGHHFKKSRSEQGCNTELSCGSCIFSH
jgi:hypothetical protein